MKEAPTRGAKRNLNSAVLSKVLAVHRRILWGRSGYAGTLVIETTGRMMLVRTPSMARLRISQDRKKAKRHFILIVLTKTRVTGIPRSGCGAVRSGAWDVRSWETLIATAGSGTGARGGQSRRRNIAANTRRKDVMIGFTIAARTPIV